MQFRMTFKKPFSNYSKILDHVFELQQIWRSKTGPKPPKSTDDGNLTVRRLLDGDRSLAHCNVNGPWAVLRVVPELGTAFGRGNDILVGTDSGDGVGGMAL